MTAGTQPPTGPSAPARSDRSPWNWLLLVAVVVPLLVPLYNRVEPTLFGWPFFYWCSWRSSPSASSPRCSPTARPGAARPPAARTGSAESWTGSTWSS